MEIKQTNQKTTHLNLFDIADSSGHEPQLSRNLAYILAKDRRALWAFLELLGIEAIERKYRSKLLESASVFTEKPHSGGSAITDIEIEIANQKIFIIIECKVKDGKATEEQFRRYETIYNQYNGYDKYFVFLSHQPWSILFDSGDIKLKDIIWRDVINTFWDECSSEDGSELQDFINYYERSYAMFNQKEILVQDVGADSEVRRFENLVYKRKESIGRPLPLYFAPYFTIPSGKPVGIGGIARILGIIRVQNIDWNKVKDKCTEFAKLAYPEDIKMVETLLKKWKAGVAGRVGEPHTYYFLDEPVWLKNPISEKRWLCNSNYLRISTNHRVTFADFIKHSNLAK